MNLLVDHPWLFAIPSVALIAFAAWLCRGAAKPPVPRCVKCRSTVGPWAREAPNVCLYCEADDDDLADQVFRTAA